MSTKSLTWLETLYVQSQPPADRTALRNWIALHAGLLLPERPVCPGHDTPLDYLEHVFFERPGTPADTVVWACRGAGKTMIGAAATLLDLIFKPGIQIRILGGSLEQSQRMYAYLRGFFDGPLNIFLVKDPTRRRLELINGSVAEILAQSDTSVRGTRVQKLRCDEVELFDPAVWAAAQLTTITLAQFPTRRLSKVRDLEDGDDGNGGNDRGDGKADDGMESSNAPTEADAACPGNDDDQDLPPIVVARGAIDALSTMHKPGGLMQEILADARHTLGLARRSFTWCVWDVIAQCREPSCDPCPLVADCQGRARHAHGFLPLIDVLAMHARVSRADWEHEMLCHPPKLQNAVFSAFARSSHVKPWPRTLGGRPSPGAKIPVDDRTLIVEDLIAGVDFGYRGPFVCLWVVMLRAPSGHRVVWIVDELAQCERTLPANVTAMRTRIPPPTVPDKLATEKSVADLESARPATHARAPSIEPWRPSIVYCDSAGRATGSHTGRTDESFLRDAGFRVRSRAMGIEEGIALLNELVNPAFGDGSAPRLFIDPRCSALIAAMEGYRRRRDGVIDKDGRHDHLIDALRYAVVNHDAHSGNVITRSY